MDGEGLAAECLDKSRIMLAQRIGLGVPEGMASPLPEPLRAALTGTTRGPAYQKCLGRCHDGPQVQYADLADPVKMVGIANGGGFMDAVNDAQ